MGRGEGTHRGDALQPDTALIERNRFTTPTVLHKDDQERRGSHPECERDSMESASHIRALPRIASITAQCEQDTMASHSGDHGCSQLHEEARGFLAL